MLYSFLIRGKACSYDNPCLTTIYLREFCLLTCQGVSEKSMGQFHTNRSSHSVSGRRAMTTFLLLSTLLAAGQYGSFCVAAAATNDQVIRLNNDGVNFLKQNNFAAAVKKFEEALKLDPSYGLARENLAIAYNNYGISMQNNPAGAIVNFHRSLYYKPGDATGAQNLEVTIQNLGKNPRKFQDRVDLGRDARKAGEVEGAIVEFSEALKLKDDPKLRVELGKLYRVKDQIDRAIEQFRQASNSKDLDIDSKVEAFTGLGQAFQAKQSYPESVAAYREAINLDRTNRDTLLANQAVWEEAVRKDPTSAPNHIGLGEAYKFLGDFGQAEAEYRQALVFDPKNQIASQLIGTLGKARADFDRDRHINAGVDLQSRKLFDQAIAEYKLALQKDPRNITTLVNLGSAYQQKEDYASAIQFYQNALAGEPSNTAAQQGLKACKEAQTAKQLKETTEQAASAFKVGKFEEALAKYRQLQNADPKDAALAFNIGATYQAMKQLDQAIQSYKQAIQLDPKNKDYQGALQKALQDKADPIIEQGMKKQTEKDYASAIALYQNALVLVPDNLKLLYNLAAAYFSRQQYPEAQKIFEQLVQKDPKNQIDNLWLIGNIQEHYGKGQEALDTYNRYLSEARGGKFASDVKQRVEALRKDITDTLKLKSETEIAQLKNAEDAYQAGVKLQQEKKWDEAVALYQKAIQLNGKDPAYPAALGSLFQQKGTLDLAIQWYVNAIQAAEKVAKPDKKLIAELNQAVKNATALKAGPMVDEAVKKQLAGDNQGAIDLYKKALTMIPDNGKIWANLGAAYQQLDAFADARASYLKAVEVAPKEEVDDWYLIAKLDEHFGEGNKAVEHYRKYVTAQPTGKFTKDANERLAALARNILATVKLPTQNELKTAKELNELADQAIKLQTAGNHKDAIPLYLKALAIKPTEINVMYGLATAYQNTGDFEHAVELYTKVIAADPKSYPEAKKLRLSCLESKAAPITDDAVKKFQAGDYQGAAAAYKQAIALVPEPENATLYTSLGTALQSGDDFGGARAAYQKAFDLDPKGQKEVLYFLGLFADHFGQGPAALEFFRRYQTESPKGQFAAYAKQRTDVLSRDASATVKVPTSQERKSAAQLDDLFDAGTKAMQAKNYDDAMSKFQECTRLAPNVSAYWLNLGASQQGANQLDGAIASYTKARSLTTNPKEQKDIDNYILAVQGGKAQPFVDEALKQQSANNFPAAVDGYRKALAIVPNNARLHTTLAACLQQMDDFNGARDEFQKAINLDRKNEKENFYFLAVLDENFNKGQLAAQEYQTYVTENASGAYVAQANQRIKELRANPAKTQRLTTQADQQKAAAVSQAYNDALKLQEEKKFDEAIAKYQEALTGMPNEYAVLYAMGTAYQAKEDLDKAIETYDKALAANPKDPNQVKTYLKQCKQFKAAPLVEQAIKKQTTPDEKGNYDVVGAIFLYEKALAIDDDPTTRMNMATAYQGNNNLPKALENYKKAIAMDKNLFDCYYYLGTAYEGLKNPAAAIIEYKKYLQFAPTGPNAAPVKERLKILGVK